MGETEKKCGTCSFLERIPNHDYGGVCTAPIPVSLYLPKSYQRWFMENDHGTDCECWNQITKQEKTNAH